MPLPSPVVDPRIQVLLAHDRPVPRYTSYPTVPAWSMQPPDDAWDQLFAALHGPCQLYVHVPFCRRQCAYCGCNMAVSKRQSAGDTYLDALQEQLDAMPDMDVRALHLGGGTPTWLDQPQLTRLLGMIRGRFGDDIEISVEADPETLDVDRLQVLAGIDRLSLGVQTLDPVVTAAVNRDQTVSAVRDAVAAARALGIHSINIDLMYGLPHQTPERFQGTLEEVVRLRPERIAVFGYAHVPQMKKHQQALTDLPEVADRAALALQADRVLTEAGYVPVGFDHYALPDDPLASGPLERGFMGYTPKALPIIGLGPSAISAVDGLFLQVEPHLGRWLRGSGRRDVVRFYHSTDDDRSRARIIETLLCELQVDVDPDEHAASLEQLQDELPGVVTVDGGHIAIDPALRLLARNAASAFDRWGGRKGSQAI